MTAWRLNKLKKEVEREKEYKDIAAANTYEKEIARHKREPWLNDNLDGLLDG